MLPPWFLAARIGQGFAEMIDDELIRELEENVRAWQGYSHVLEKRLKSLAERYDEVLKENNVLRKIIMDLKTYRNPT